jgi:cyclohexyl-isocyanide hydratase
MSDFDVGFVIFPGITQLHFTGPFEVLSRLSTPPSISVQSKFSQSRTHVIAKTLQPVSSDRGLSILPTCTFDNSPSLNLICVPGGAGVVDALADVETVDFIRRQSAQAQFVTSVCIGAFLLGAAGLLKGVGRQRIGPTLTCCRWRSWFNATKRLTRVSARGSKKWPSITAGRCEEPNFGIRR